MLKIAKKIIKGDPGIMDNHMYWNAFRICEKLKLTTFSRKQMPDSAEVNTLRIPLQMISRHIDPQMIHNGTNWDENVKNDRELLTGIKKSSDKLNAANPVEVVIDRNGHFILASGVENAAGSIEDNNLVSRVIKRHPQWESFRMEAFRYSQRNQKGSYQPFQHPDLEFIKHHRSQDSDRWDMISKHVDTNKGTVLDIGSNLGYFCHKFEEMGFDCTGVEKNYLYLYFNTKVRDACDRKYKILPVSVFDLPDTKYNIVLALSIFHHFIRSPLLFESMTRLLKRLDMDMMFFEPHQTGHALPGTIKEFTEEEFVKYIIDNSCLKSAELIGRGTRGRPIYLLKR